MSFVSFELSWSGCFEGISPDTKDLELGVMGDLYHHFESKRILQDDFMCDQVLKIPSSPRIKFSMSAQTKYSLHNVRSLDSRRYLLSPQVLNSCLRPGEHVFGAKCVFPVCSMLYYIFHVSNVDKVVCNRHTQTSTDALHYFL